MYYFQTDIDDLKRQNGILDQQGMALVFREVMSLMVRNILHDVNLCLSTLCPPAIYPSSWSVLPLKCNFLLKEN